MTSSELELAYVADAADEPVRAIQHYTAGLPSTDAEVDDFLNLAVLYMECGDFGFASYHKIPSQWSDEAGSLALEVLDAASVRFPLEPEIQFWKLYVPWILWGTEPDLSALKLMAHEGRAQIVFLLLVQFNPSDENKRGASGLLNHYRHGKSQRARYITSVLESALREWDSGTAR